MRRLNQVVHTDHLIFEFSDTSAKNVERSSR